MRKTLLLILALAAGCTGNGKSSDTPSPVGNYCRADLPCPTPYTCSYWGNCTKPCTSGADCPSDAICVGDGQCHRLCDIVYDCEPSESCLPPTPSSGASHAFCGYSEGPPDAAARD